MREVVQAVKNAPTPGRTHPLLPPTMHDGLRSTGQPLDLATRSFMEPRFGHDFSRVRVHTDACAAASARDINALAYTVGNEIVFGAGQFMSRTSEGSSLLAHELAHTIQQGRRPATAPLSIGPAASVAERETQHAASQIATGFPAGPISASTGPLLQRQPAKAGAFDNEDPALQTRRLNAIGALRIAFQRLNTGLTGGFLWSFETVTPSGIDLTPIVSSLSPEAESARNARLKKLLSDLMLVISDLESAPIPASWLISPVNFPGKGSYSAHGPQDWEDAQMFYAHRNVGLGMGIVTTNVFYIETAPLPTKRLKGVAIATGVQTGNFIVVPNPDKEPLVYHRFDQYGAWNSGEEAIEVWHDQLGYYYLGKDGSKHYLPNWPNN